MDGRKEITYVLDLRSREVKLEQAPDRIRKLYTYYSIVSDRMNDSQKRFRKDYQSLYDLNAHQKKLKK